jgi:hypothetical protein
MDIKRIRSVSMTQRVIVPSLYGRRDALSVNRIYIVHVPNQLCVNRKHGPIFGACFLFIKNRIVFDPYRPAKEICV